MFHRFIEPAEVDEGNPQCAVGFENDDGIAKVVRQNQQVGGDLVSGPHLRTKVVEEAQQPLNHERLTGIALLRGEFECASINLLHFGGSETFNRHQRDAEDDAQPQLLLRPFKRLGRALENLKSPARQRGGLVMSRAVRRILGCLCEVFDGARVVPTLLEMHRQFRGDLANTIAVDRFASLTDPAVDLGASHRRQEAVGHLEIENVVELVARGHCPIRQLDETGWRQELVPSHQRFASLFDPVCRLIESGSYGHRRALHPHDTRPFQYSSLVLTETLDLFLD